MKDSLQYLLLSMFMAFVYPADLLLRGLILRDPMVEEGEHHKAVAGMVVALMQDQLLIACQSKVPISQNHKVNSINTHRC